MSVGFKTTYNGRETEIDDLLIKREFFGDGGLYSWGNNATGRLGDDTTTNRSSPGSTAAGLGLNWKDLSSSGGSSAAIKTDGTLWTWGACTYGQLGTNNTTSRSSPGTTSGGGTNWKQLSCGEGSGFMAAIKTDGTLWTWGADGYGQLGDGTTTGRSSPGQTAGAGTNWKQVSCSGNGATAAIKIDGTLWTWGRASTGQLGTNDTTSRSSPGITSGGGTNWKQVSCGYRMAAIKTDGTLWTWGRNFSGNLGDGTTTNRSSPVTTSGGGTNWKQVAAPNTGYDSGMAAIKTDGTLWTWGSGGQGQLGDGGTTNRSSPVQTSGGGTTWKQVTFGNETGMALTDLTI